MRRRSNETVRRAYHKASIMLIYPLHWLVEWLSGRTSVSDRRTFTDLHRTCSW